MSINIFHVIFDTMNLRYQITFFMRTIWLTCCIQASNESPFNFFKWTLHTARVPVTEFWSYTSLTQLSPLYPRSPRQLLQEKWINTGLWNFYCQRITATWHLKRNLSSDCRAQHVGTSTELLLTLTLTLTFQSFTRLDYNFYISNI